VEDEEEKTVETGNSTRAMSIESIGIRGHMGAERHVDIG